jgi:hypothetical protein
MKHALADSPNAQFIHDQIDADPFGSVQWTEVIDKVEYPIEALGEILGDAAKAIAEGVQTPPEIAAHSVLAVAAFAAQDKANVSMDGRVIPISLFLLTIAESGDRKSACDKVASVPLETWQREGIKDHVDKLQEYKNRQDVYDTERKLILGNKKPGQEKAQELENLSPPESPLEPIAICQEPTLEGLQRSFRIGRPSQALFNDEGAQFFGGHSMNKDNMTKTIAGLSKYWDGSPIIRTRSAQGESVSMFDRRLSIHLQAQPVITDKVLNNPILMAQGWLARFLIADSDSKAGTRLYRAVNANEHPAVLKFHSNIGALLTHVPATHDGGGLDLPSLNLSPDAKAYWVQAYDNVERSLLAGGLFEQIKPIASKAGENTLRLAGVFAIVEDTAEITESQVSRAWHLMMYYLQSMLRTTQLGEVSRLERDTLEVLQWLKRQEGVSCTIKEMQKRITPARHRKSVGHIRIIMAGLVQAMAVEVTDYNSKSEPCAWVVRS